MVLVRVAEEDRVNPTDAVRPERRGDDPAPDGRVAHPPAIVEKSLAAGVRMMTANPCPTARTSASGVMDRVGMTVRIRPVTLQIARSPQGPLRASRPTREDRAAAVAAKAARPSSP